MATATVDRSICYACRVILNKFEIDTRVICAYMGYILAEIIVLDKYHYSVKP